MNELRFAKAAFWITAVAVLASASLASMLDDRALTPVFFDTDPLRQAFGIRWTVLGAQLLVLAALIVKPVRLLGVSLATLFAAANLMALSINGASGVFYFGFSDYADWPSLWLVLFLVAQFIAFLCGLFCLVAELMNNKTNRARAVMWVLLSLVIVVAWAAMQLRIAGASRILLENGPTRHPVTSAWRTESKLTRRFTEVWDDHRVVLATVSG